MSTPFVPPTVLGPKASQYPAQNGYPQQLSSQTMPYQGTPNVQVPQQYHSMNYPSQGQTYPTSQYPQNQQYAQSNVGSAVGYQSPQQQLQQFPNQVQYPPQQVQYQQQTLNTQQFYQPSQQIQSQFPKNPMQSPQYQQTINPQQQMNQQQIHNQQYQQVSNQPMKPNSQNPTSVQPSSQPEPTTVPQNKKNQAGNLCAGCAAAGACLFCLFECCIG